MPGCALVTGTRLLAGLLFGLGLLPIDLRSAYSAPANARLAEVKQKIKHLESELTADAIEIKKARAEMLELDRELQAARAQQQEFETELTVKTALIRALGQQKTALARQMADDAATLSGG